MKCFNLEENLNLLLDGEITFPQNQESESHLAACENCRVEATARRAAQSLLRNQPTVLPAEVFDKRMLQTFEKLRPAAQKTERNPFKKFFVFSNPVLRFGFAAGVLLTGLGLAFFLGRMSVATVSNAIPLQFETATVDKSKSEKQILPSAEKSVNNEKSSVSSDAKVITKYIRIPVVKQRIIERTVRTDRKISDSHFQTVSKSIKENDLAKQFNLKDLQPVSKVSYKIIRKGENNEQ